MRHFIFLCAFLSVSVLHSQQFYQYKTGKEAAWLGSGALGMSTYLLLDRHNPALSPAEITQLNPDAVWKIDRYSLHHYSRTARNWSDVLVTTSYALPAVMALDPKMRKEIPGFWLIQAEAALGTLTLASLTKATVRRNRPFNYNPDAPLSEKLKKDARYSFFSGHTSMSACMTFSSAQIWCDLHPDSGYKPLVWAGAALYPLTVGWLRMKGGKHFPTDVATGYLVGAGMGLLLPRLHIAR